MITGKPMAAVVVKKSSRGYNREKEAYTDCLHDSHSRAERDELYKRKQQDAGFSNFVKGIGRERKSAIAEQEMYLCCDTVCTQRV